MSFWDVVWFIIVGFAFAAYLMMLFAIVTDLFRDRDTSGVVKAIWLIGLLFLPFLSALVYVIVRGRGMSERAAESHRAAVEEQEAYIKDVAGPATPAEQIAKASDLLEAGTISQAEFDTLKAKALV